MIQRSSIVAFALFFSAACQRATDPPTGSSASARSTAPASSSATPAPSASDATATPAPLDPMIARALDEELDALGKTDTASPSAPLPGTLARCFPLPSGPLAKSAAAEWRKQLGERASAETTDETALVSIGTIRPSNPTLCLAKNGGAWKLVGYVPGA